MIINVNDLATFYTDYVPCMMFEQHSTDYVPCMMFEQHSTDYVPCMMFETA